MSVDDLMKVRYKVIADFWDNPFEIGTILIFEFLREPFMPPIEELESGNVTQYLYTDFIPLKDGGSCSYAEIQFSKYPHLFQKLEWWQERGIKDMPKYFKLFDCVIKVLGYRIIQNEIYSISKYKGQLLTNKMYRLFDSQPSTIEEYNEYKSKNK